MEKDRLVEDKRNKIEGYMMLGMWEEALEEVEGLLGLDKDNFHGHYYRGTICLQLKDHGKAEESFLRVLELRRDFAEGFVHLAYIYRRTVGLDKAIETIRKAVEMKPSLAIANYNLGCYYAIKGDRDGAIEYLRKAVTIDGKYRQLARKDEDFESLRDDDEFLRLVE